MKKLMIALIPSLLFFFYDMADARAADVSFQWFGQACFSIVTPKGTTIITDPVDFSSRNIPYKIPQGIHPDIVTVSHEHGDHNAVNAVSGSPKIIRGLTSGGKAFSNSAVQFRDVKLSMIESYHDKEKGKQRGLNAIFVFEFDNLRIAHLGDLGHMLDEKQIQGMGPIDILLIPVGGGPTINAQEATELVSRLKPKLLVIPMHFKTDVVTFMPDSAEEFVAGKKNVKPIKGNRYAFDVLQPPEQLEYVVLDYKSE